VDQAAERVPPQNLDIRAWDRWMRAPGGRVLVQCPVRPVRVVVIDVLIKDQPQMPFAGDQHPVQALAADTGDPLWVPKTCVTWVDAVQIAVGSTPRSGVGAGRCWSVRRCDDLRLVGLKLIFLIVTRAVSVLGLSRREAW
jgi:hypothetical protein